METPEQDDIVGQAIAWHLRLDDASPDAWRAFVLWLEASPAHAQAYDRLTLDDDLLVNPVVSDTALPPPADDASGARRWRPAVAVGGLLAVAAASVLLLSRPPAPTSDRYLVSTAPGIRREVQLAGGTRIELNGGTRLTLDRANPRFAQLDAGEAVFRVRHDAAAPFALRSGAIEMRDLGTVFNVMREGRRLSIQVGEGAVMFRPEREAIVLRPGTQLAIREDQDRVTIGRVAADSVGSWRRGWLVLHDTPIASLAQAIERATAAHVSVAPELADVPFTGSIRLSGGAGVIIPRVAALINARWARNGDLWTLSSREHGTPSD